ncbi:Mitochondrial carrier protein [Aureococcus anophagefferens]|uniref:Mitochondrial carrier protein n=1 Tax=Aureococcus anophagefferens TaxID=44056 RepID=A0ABR1G3P5_AURAN
MMQLDGLRDRPARRSAPHACALAPRTMLGGALKKAVGGGIPGAVAMVLQVVLLMWLRTTVNYQMRHGGSLIAVMRLLYAEGGVARFYSGMSMALLQGPLSRFGDTAANAGMLALLEGSKMPVLVQTACGTARWGDGRGFLGHYPWFATNNWLESTVPPTAGRVRTLARRAFIGFCSSVVERLRVQLGQVVKTFAQTSDVPVTYVEAATFILNRDGVAGLLWRGLAAKILCNGLSSVLFSVIWKSMMDRMEPKPKEV